MRKIVRAGAVRVPDLLRLAHSARIPPPGELSRGTRPLHPTTQTPPAKAAEAARPIANLRGHSAAITALAFTADRCLLASADREGPARIWNVASSKPGERAAIRTPGERFQSLAFSPNSRTLALGSGSEGGMVWLFDVSEKTPKEVVPLRGPKGAVNALAFSPDGKTVAGGGEDQTVRLWEPAPGSRGEPRTLLLGHSRPVQALAFSHDGRGLASAAQDATVRVWSVSRIRSYERACVPHPADVTSLLFVPDGNTLATACRDGVIRLWDLMSIKPRVRAELKGHAGAKLLLLATDGTTLVSAGGGPRVVNWDVRTGNQLREWELPAVPPVAALTVDGRYLARGDDRGDVELFRVAEKRA